MANCIKINQNFTDICGCQAGVDLIFLAPKSSITKGIYNTTFDQVSGFTFSGTGTTYFYKIIPPKGIATFMDTTTYNENMVYTIKPKLTFQMPGTSASAWLISEQLLKGEPVVAVIKYKNGDFMIGGLVNGLSPSGNGTWGTDANSKIGSTIELEGNEPYLIQKLSSDLAATFESTYVISI